MKIGKALSKHFESKSTLSIWSRLIMLLVVVLVPLMLIQFYFLYDRYQHKKSDELQTNLEAAQAASRAFELFIQDVLNQQAVVGLALSSQRMTPEEMNRFLEKVNSGLGMVRNYAWLSPEGRVLAARLPKIVGMDVSDRDYYRKILSGKDWVVSDLMESRLDGKPIFTISTGIRDEGGQLLGVVLSVVLPEGLDELLGVERSRGGGITLGDSKGMLVYRYPHDENLDWEKRQRYVRSFAIREALEGREAVEIIPVSHFDGTSRFIASTPIRSIGWVAGAGRLYEHVMWPLYASIFGQTGLLIVVTALSLVVAFVISKTITTPINAIKNQLRAMGEGKLQLLANVGGPPEIQDFSQAFNTVLSELNETTAILRAVSEITPDLIYVKDRKNRLLYANPATLKTIGKPEAEILGRSEMEWHCDLQQAQAIMENDRRVMDSGQTEVMEETFSALDGTRVFLSSKSPYVDESGEVIGVIGLSRDISERKKVEEELRHSEKRLSLAIKTSQIGMFEWDVLTGQSRWTQEYEIIMGYPVSEDGLRSYRHWADRVHPDDLTWVEERVQRAMVERKSYQAEYRILWADGSLHWVEGQGVFTFDSEGRATKMLGTVRDITEHRRVEDMLRRQEMRLREAAEIAHVGAWEFDPVTLEGSWTEEAARIHDLDPASEMDATKGLSFFHGEFRTRIEAAVKDAITLGKPYDLELELVTAKGAQKWVRTICHPILEEGRVVRVRGSIQDITERKRIEEDLRNSLDEKTALLKEVHHRVKNNLQIVASLLGLQSSRVGNSEIVDVLQDTRNRVRSMSLLHEMLYKSPNLARIDFGPYIRDLCGHLLLSYGSGVSMVRVEHRVSPIGLPLEQAVPCGLIVSELVSNALKHGYPDGRPGRVTVELFHNDDGALVLSVRDDGVGLPLELDLSNNATLGLQLVSRLAAQLGGRLKVDRPGPGGTAIGVVFPVPSGTLMEGKS